MGDSVKAVVTYDDAWWKQDGLSGGLYSNDGPVAQMYDQSDENGAAIVGFLDDSTADWTESQRQEAVIDQLVRVFGDKAQGYKTYKDTAWRNEPFTMPTGEARLPGAVYGQWVVHWRHGDQHTGRWIHGGSGVQR